MDVLQNMTILKLLVLVFCLDLCTVWFVQFIYVTGKSNNSIGYCTWSTFYLTTMVCHFLPLFHCR